MTRLIVFDVDGTILDSMGFFERVLHNYSLKAGLPSPCMDTIKLGYAEPHNHDFKWGVERHEQEHHLRAVWQMSDAISMSGKPEDTPDLFPGVAQSLAAMKDEGHTLAIVTSKPEDPLLHLLEHHDIGWMFSAIRARDDMIRRKEREKPAPDMLKSVMRELSFAPENTVMIGDTTMDIHMGLASETHTIGVTWGAHKKDILAEAGAHHIVDAHFDGVTPVIKKIFG